MLKNINDGGLLKLSLAILLAILGAQLVDYLTYDRAFLGIAIAAFSEAILSSYREKISASDMTAKLFRCALVITPVLAFCDWITRAL